LSCSLEVKGFEELEEVCAPVKINKRDNLKEEIEAFEGGTE